MNLMEWIRAGRRRRQAARDRDITDRLEFGVVDVALETGDDGVLLDRLADPEKAAPICPGCDQPAVGEITTAEDGSTWHSRCKLHLMFGHLGDRPDATNCAVCGAAL